ncbi:MAG: WecB/TagA/CpsF family glycosyltransferase [Chloroflexota bacterium]
MSRRILCVQLADIGDLILTTPALRALRDALPDAHIALLTTPHAAPIIPDALVDEIITFNKHTFDSPRALANVRNWPALLALWRSLDSGIFDTVVFFHHFSTRFGMLKFVGMALASGAQKRIGLRSEKTGFLNAGIDEMGFGAMHQAQYWLRLVDVVTGEQENETVIDAQQPAELHNQYTGKRMDLFTEYVPPRVIGQMNEYSVLRLNNAFVSRELAGQDEHRPQIAIHAGSGGFSTARRWEPEKFAEVALRLIDEHNAHIVFVGTKNDDTESVKLAMRVLGTTSDLPITDLTGKTTLLGLVTVLETCQLFIGADSGVMHMAAASGVPTVAVFGPSNHAAWGPWSPEGPVTVVRSAPICSPCSYVGTGVGLRGGCEARTCMKMVTAEAVYDAAVNLLNGEPGSAGGRGHASPLRTTERVYILGVPVDKLTYDTLLEHIAAWIGAKDGLHQMCTVNPEFVMMAQRDPNFHNILNRVDLCLPDGVGLVYAARYLRDPLPGRVTGSDGVPIIAQRAAQEGWRLFLLGAAEGIADRAAEVLRKRYPGVQIAGTYSGSPRAQDEDTIVEIVNAANADILFVAYGAPEQDKWIARNAPRLNVSVAMGVGGTFDYLAGVVPLAPQWMRDAGLDWLFRLVRQPGRIRRQMRLPAFVVAVLLHGRR